VCSSDLGDMVQPNGEAKYLSELYGSDQFHPGTELVFDE